MNTNLRAERIEENISLDEFQSKWDAMQRLRQLADELLLQARRGATIAELTTAAREGLGDAPPRAEINAIARTVFDKARRQLEHEQCTHDIVAAALAGYPANALLAPIVVNAVPFPSGPSFWTRPEMAA